MKPKELLDMFEALAMEAAPEEKPYYDGLCEGATQMYKATHKYFDKYRENNREKLREYARSYQRNKDQKEED